MERLDAGGQPTSSKPRAFSGVFVPKDLLRDKCLSAALRLLYAEVAALCRGPKGCTASNAHLAERLGVCERQIQRQIAQLVRKGYLTSTVRIDPRVIGGRVRALRVVVSGTVTEPEKMPPAGRRGGPDRDEGEAPSVTAETPPKTPVETPDERTVENPPPPVPPAPAEPEPAGGGGEADAPKADPEAVKVLTDYNCFPAPAWEAARSYTPEEARAVVDYHRARDLGPGAVINAMKRGWRPKVTLTPRPAGTPKAAKWADIPRPTREPKPPVTEEERAERAALLAQGRAERGILAAAGFTRDAVAA